MRKLCFSWVWLPLLPACAAAAAAGRPEPTSTQPRDEMALWYRRPAREWLKAMPIGNGFLGAMVFGGAAEERIALLARIAVEVEELLAAIGRPPDVLEAAVGQGMVRLRLAVARGVLEMQPFPDRLRRAAQRRDEIDAIDARGALRPGQREQRRHDILQADGLRDPPPAREAKLRRAADDERNVVKSA